ncbi:hypothetical protein GALMADRAFT_137350 [Galerina marginata CBS 339.88]|uniref:Transmembrane protein n=1 Tax=Galerina marginata (strain CBS 339.88) TaxID=685588 RepID=A0A067TI17_GALM3|nr:hypothetical protein GALMADRAFT_137350 [Galerina marginata CBS 339.88]
MVRWLITNNTDPEIKYSDGWFADTSVRPGTLHVALSASSFSYTFNGTSVVVKAIFLSDSPPSWECVLDSNKTWTFTSPKLNGDNRWDLCSYPYDDGTHTVVVNVNASAASPVALDYIAYFPSSPTSPGDVYYLWNDPDIQYGVGWSAEEQGITTQHLGATWNLNFIGRSVTWWGFYNNTSHRLPTTASYTIDGGTPVNFTVGDLGFAESPLSLDQIVFETQDYTLGKHQIEVIYNANDSNLAPLSFSYLTIHNVTDAVPPRTSHKARMDGAITGSCIVAVIALVLLGTFIRRRAEGSKHAAGEISEDPEVVEPFNHIPTVAWRVPFTKGRQINLETDSEEPGMSQAEEIRNNPRSRKPQEGSGGPQAALDVITTAQEPAIPQPIPSGSRAVEQEDSGIQFAASNTNRTDDVVEAPPTYTPV